MSLAPSLPATGAATATAPRLILANGGVQAADQLALATLPLMAVFLIGADAATLGALVAAQSAAWLLVSLPGGVWVDRAGPGRMIALAPLLALGGLSLALTAGWIGSVALLGVGVAIAAAATVLHMLAQTALIPRLVGSEAFVALNARLELVRAVVSLAAPLLVGLAAERGLAGLGFAAALVAALVALTAARGFHALPAPASTEARPPLLAAIREGAAFCLGEPLLRGILLCAIFWNAAFFALQAGFVPYAAEVLGLSAAQIGLGLSAYGVGLILGALTAKRLVGASEPRLVLVFGPGVSCLAVLLLLAAGAWPGVALVALGYFLIGFGPLLWLICQTTIRQRVTPPELMGRSAATIQTAIYGVRPLGALLGGAVGAWFGPTAPMLLVALGFALSLLMVVLSPLAGLKTLPTAPERG